MTTQASKKPSSQASAKLASNFADKAAKNTYAAVESTRNSAENVIKIGGNAVKEFLSTGADEAQKAQEKLFAIGRESAENFAKSADSFTQAMTDAIGSSRENIQACVECGNLTASLMKDLSTEAFEATNKAFSDQVELSKEFFACRTFSDMFELQNRAFSQAMDSFFSESAKISEMLFEYSSEALEPINERVAEATEQFSKALSAA